MIVSILILSLCTVALFQPTRERAYPALIFAVFTVSHDLLAPYLDGLAYYWSAAFCDMIVVIITANLTCTPRIIRDIHHVCLASIVLNASGWVAWRLYLEPLAYNISFIFLYVWAIIILLRGDTRSVRENQMDNWAYFLRFNTNTCRYTGIKL